MNNKVVPDKLLEPVLAEISALGDGGWYSTWYEVVYYDTNKDEWCSFAGSDTFSHCGFKVLKWVYAKDCFE